MYDLIVVKPKLNKWKVIACICATIIIVSIATIDGIFCATRVKAAKFAEQIVMQAEALENYQEQVLIMEETKRVEEIRSKIPTWENLQQVRHIYAAKEEKRVFLTFDDGPSKSITPQILDLLKQEQIKATFFVLGKNVEKNPSIVKRAYEEGHYIANHGYSHEYGSIYESTDSLLAEYNRTEDVIRKAIENESYSSHLFRYPGGSSGGKYKEIKKEAKTILEANQIYYLDWNALTKDAEGAKTKEQQLENLAGTVGEKSSVVVLMHDSSSKTVTYETLPDIIAFFRERGYQFKNIYDLMQE